MAANAGAGAGGSKIRNAKLVLLGDVGTGKSSLVLCFVKGQFVEFRESIIGAAFFSQTLAVNDETVKFKIWDTAGQERYHSLAPMYYHGATAAIVVYDITNAVQWEQAHPPQFLATARLPECILPPIPGASGPLIVVAGEVRIQV